MTDTNKVAVFGGTGFLGTHICTDLVASGFSVILPIRNQQVDHKPMPGVLPVSTGKYQHDHMVQILSDCQAVVYAIGIIREYPGRGISFQHIHHTLATQVMDAAMAAGVQRFILISANGVDDASTPYESTKLAAEAYLASSGLDWTILRPSLIFGDPGNRTEFCTQMRDQMIAPPLPIPLFFPGLQFRSAGQFRMSPIHVGDVARTVTASIHRSLFLTQIVPLGGPEALTWKELLCRLAMTLERRKWFVPVPAGIILAAAKFLDSQSWFPVTRDQLTMLMKGNTCDSQSAFRQMGFEPIALNTQSLAYLKSSNDNSTL